MHSFLGRLAGMPARAFAPLRKDESGSVAIVFGLMAVVLLLAVGAAVDFSRWLNARDQTIAAVDAAVLAGGRALQISSKDHGAAIAAAENYYRENVSTRLDIIPGSDSIKFAIAPDGMGVTASGNAYIKTPLLAFTAALGFAPIDKLPLLGSAETNFARSEIAVGGNGGESIEVSIMLDITGSMCNSAPGTNQSPCRSGRKIDAMKEAAKDLVNIVVWEDQSKFTSKVAIVPFSDSVRLPSNVIDKAWGSPAPELSITKTTGSGRNVKTYYYNRTSACVVERAGSNRYTDAAPSKNNYVLPIRWEVDEKKKTQVADCTLGTESAVMPLTNNKQQLLDKITGLTGKGGTAGQVGTAWAWYTLSPNWNSLWPSSSAAAYGRDDLRKIAVLMTDGEYNAQYTADGIATGSSGAGSTPANADSATQAKALCEGMKAKGITVYTVGFAIGYNASAKDVLNKCATDPTKYYNAENEDQLRDAFRDIALKLSSLYISK